MKHAVSEDMVGTECNDSLSRLENLCSYIYIYRHVSSLS